ncbi:MAG TPA: wax ester/triacylglycerol synthase family O-acyltransferase [Solirubrobacteraceae bacterium]|nr:wax ester/triacylglycerol synthase family O-acyltransferase [Solirubrobacteraceae bacterium]HSD82172.1 wax ester/triacylglycerol synthase family O-acyltransferase [Solirubrobacteraceae bacterium]
MAQDHFDRLTALDASFLHQEGPSSHMHVGAVTIFEGPPPPFADVLDHVRMRLHLVPRYRQRLSVPPLQTGRPLWVDDPAFNLEYHVRQTALPRPGSEDQLLRLAARIFSQQLDRSKPLWELWLVEGLAPAAGGQGPRFALISKTHHAMIDGIAGVDIAQVLFDLGPVPAEIPHPDAAWEAAPEPTPVELVAAGALGAVRGGLHAVTRAAELLTRPASALREAREAAEGLGEVAWAGLNPAPDTPLNVPIGPHRRYAVVRNELRDFKLVKDAFGGTVNDVVLTVVSGALRRWLHSRGVRTQGLELRALVPVSIRAAHERGDLGNRIAAMRGPLPVYIEDPVARLRAVRRAMDGLKDSKQAVGAEVLASAQNFAPPTILAQASRLNFSTRLFNLIVTNVPGPQFPLYVLGRELEDVFPVAFLPKEHALAIAIMSYNGRINFGLLADYDAVPDLATLADGISESLGELVTRARRATGGDGAPSGGGPRERPARTREPVG